MNQKILLVEDELHIAEGIKLALGLQNYDVEVAPDGAFALKVWPEYNPDLIILDLMLPTLDGFSVLQKIREKDERIPILVLTALDSANDKMNCFNSGVDDYLTKPFNIDELVVRIKRLLTKANWYHDRFDRAVGDSFSFGKNVIDFQHSVAICRNQQIDLTVQEMRLLKMFIANQGRPLAREALLEAGWGYAKDTNSRTLDNFIVRFRKYFEEDPKNPKYFKSIRAVGYLFSID